MTNDPETALLYDAQNGCGAAQETLIRKYKGLVRRQAAPYFLAGGDREDIVQEGMIGLVKAIRDYDADKAVRFATFAALCIRRQILTAIKTASRRKHAPLNDFEVLDAEDAGLAAAESNPEIFLLNKESRTAILKHIENALSDREARVLLLHLQGLSYAEIAEALDKDVKSVDNTLQRVRKKISTFLKNQKN